MGVAGTHVVVLAAGSGSRLGALGAGTPKWLLDVRGKTLAHHQLDAVRHAEAAQPGSIASVRVITGHAAAKIGRFLAARRDVSVEVVHNPEFARLNNWYSVLLALRSIPDQDGAPVVIFNSDLFADSLWMAQFVIDSAKTPFESLIGVDLRRSLTNEAMMVSASPDGPSSAGTLASIGKMGVDEPIGEYVGMLMARGSVLRAFRATLEGFVGRPDTANEWYESAVGNTAQLGARWTIWPTPNSAWVEIDDDRDHAVALELSRRG